MDHLWDQTLKVWILSEDINLAFVYQYFSEEWEELRLLVVILQILEVKPIQTICQSEVFEDSATHDHLDEQDSELENIYLLSIDGLSVFVYFLICLWDIYLFF